MNKKEVISFRKDILPGQSMILEERIKAPGTIEEVRIRFYAGQELALKVRPYVEHKGEKNEELLTYSASTDGYLAGDDDYFSIPVVVSVDYDDMLKVHVINTDTTFPYTLTVFVVVDYFAGKNRVIGGIL